MRKLIPVFLLLVGCTLPPAGRPQIALQGDLLLQTDTLWQGDVLVDGQVTVAHGVTLSLAPGTRVRFVRRDADRDGLGDATIIVKGSLIASGTEIMPISFLSAEKNPAPGDWLEIRSDFAELLNFDWCEFRDSAYTLHAHFTRGHLRNSLIHYNIDGCRLGRSRFLIQNNLIEHNSGKGINFRDSEVTLTDNIIRDNRAGIFLFEKPGASVIEQNNIYRNELNLQLGDFFAEDIELANNWWGSADPQTIARSIYDRQEDAELGQVVTAPAAGWIFSAGRQRTAELASLWQVPTEGFIDAAPLWLENSIVFASWDGSLRAVDTAGQIVWTAATGDVIDAGLLAVDGQVYLQNWKRQFYKVDQQTGAAEMLFEYPASPADDHRQAGLVATDRLILLPAWNGILYAFERSNLQLRWQYAAGQPLRAAPGVTENRIYLPSGKPSLIVLDLQGRLIWEKPFTEPFLSTPLVFSDKIVLLDKTGTLTALSLDGVLLWQTALEQASFYAAPLFSQGALFVATAAGQLWKLNPEDGQTIWVRDLGHSIYASPLGIKAGILVGDNEGHLFLLDPDSGRTLTRMKVDGAIQSQALVTGNRLYFGSRDRNLHALEIIRGESAGE